MSKKKKKMTLKDDLIKEEGFDEKVKKAAEGLYYISETDAEIFPFAGEKAAGVTKEEVLRQTKSAPETLVEERDFEEMFVRLTKMQDWFGDEEKATAEKFTILRDLLRQYLTDLRVFKLGRIELDIYFVGLDADGVLKGIKTKAIET